MESDLMFAKLYHKIYPTRQLGELMVPSRVPVVVTRDSPDLTVEINGQTIKMICNTAKWSCHFGFGESKETIRVTFRPREKDGKLRSEL